MLIECHGIVLKNIPFKDNQIICHIYTAQLGKESFITNTSSKKNAQHALFQPTSIIDFTIEHKPNKNIFRIKNPQWKYLYQPQNHNILRHCIKLFLVDLIHQSIKLPEQNSPMFELIYQFLIITDQIHTPYLNLIPLIFTYQFWLLLGHDYSPELTKKIYALKGSECPYFTEFQTFTHNIKTTQDFNTIIQIPIPNTIRKELLETLIQHYNYIIPNFNIHPSFNIIKQILA